jgi:peptidoglycan/xylan/chitin deacetylase (PgdA/CDA1 family)
LGLKGTFYIASQLATGRQLPSLDEQFASLDDVLRLQKMGHEIGCHTFTHYKLRNGSANELAWDACRNRQMLLDSGVHVKNFAYPYGQVTASAKAKLKPHYETLRSTYQGINEGKVDLGCLSVFNLYSETLDRDMVSKIVRETVRKNAWTIFYTHGVEEFPNRYGSTQDDLKWAIDTCQNAGAQVLSISDALDRIRKS